MASPNVEIVLHGQKENKETKKVHDARGLWMTWINYGDHGLVIAPKLNTFPGKMGVPYGIGNNYEKTFLLFDTYARYSAELQVR